MNPESDPADFTVDEVTAYLATASPDEFARVQDAERSGKARKGVLDYTQADTDPEALEPDEDGYTRRVVSS